MSGAGPTADTKLRVLVAVSDPTVRLFVASIVHEFGHEVLTVHDPREAVRRVEDRRPAMAVIDTGASSAAGLELCRAVRKGERRRDIFILALVDRDHPEALEQVLDAGADEFASKPLNADHLRARLVVARRRVEEDSARRSAEDALAQARWLAGIGEATLALQHEINNPLSALLGCAELLQLELKDRNESNELVDIILEQAQRIADVVRRLRKLKNPQSVDYVGGSRMIDLSRGPNT